MHREAESREEAQTKGHADERGDERVAALDRAPIEQRPQREARRDEAE